MHLSIPMPTDRPTPAAVIETLKCIASFAGSRVASLYMDCCHALAGRLHRQGCWTINLGWTGGGILAWQRHIEPTLAPLAMRTD